MTALISPVPVKLNPAKRDVDAIIGDIAAGPTLSTRAMNRHLFQAGCLASPKVLQAAWQHQRITGEQLALFLPRIWSYAEYPEDCLTRPEWLVLFTATGFTSNGATATPPTRITLYRGAPLERRYGWSWTDHLLAATAHATFLPGRKQGCVWTTTAPASHLLLHRDHVDFDEYVVQTKGLDIWPVPTAELRVAADAWDAEHT